MSDFPRGLLGDRLDAKLVAFDPYYPTTLILPYPCQPDEVMAWWTQADLLRMKDGVVRTVTSLLPLTCPDAWSTVATFVKSGVSTQAMCCPT